MLNFVDPSARHADAKTFSAFPPPQISPASPLERREPAPHRTTIIGEGIFNRALGHPIMVAGALLRRSPKHPEGAGRRLQIPSDPNRLRTC